MLTDEHGGVRRHKNRHLAERFEGMLGVMMVIAIALLAVGLVYGMVANGGDSTPAWLR